MISIKTIKLSEVKTLPRGRRAEFDSDLLDALAQIKAGTAGVLDEEFGAVTDKVDRSRIQGVIRKHWERVHSGTKCSVRWSPEGFAQVSQAPTKK